MMSPLLFSRRTVEERIRTAYLLRRPWCSGAFPRSAVWMAAASNLISAHRRDPDLPMDPELFVASQRSRGGVADPWSELTHSRSIDRYRRRVQIIVRQLRRELLGEIRWVHRRLERGLPLDSVLKRRTESLTPLGRYVTAVRCGRDDLAVRFVEEAIRQHHGSPLYRNACRGLLAEELYPADLPVSLSLTSSEGRMEPLFSLN